MVETSKSDGHYLVLCGIIGMMKSMQTVVIIGAGGQASETASYIQRDGGEVAFFAVNKEYCNERQDFIDVENPPQNLINNKVINAIGPPLLRPGVNFISVVSGNAYVDDSAVVMGGTTIAPLSFIGPNIKIGMHCLVNAGSTISHDCVLGDYVTVSPGTNIGGKVKLGDGVFLGIGAVVKNNVSIAAGVVVGAGAVVIRDITEQNTVYVGNPAKKLKTNQDWLDEIK